MSLSLSSVIEEINKVSIYQNSTTMDNFQLVDLGFNGPKFTWINKRKSNPIFEKLDRGWA